MSTAIAESVIHNKTQGYLHHYENGIYLEKVVLAMMKALKNRLGTVIKEDDKQRQVIFSFDEVKKISFEKMSNDFLGCFMSFNMTMLDERVIIGMVYFSHRSSPIKKNGFEEFAVYVQS